VLKLLLHGVGSYAPGALVGPTYWPHHDLIVIVEGRIDFSLGRRKISCGAGDALVIPPGNGFRGTAGGEGATIWVQHFSPGGAKTAISLPRTPVCWRGVGQWEWPRALMRRLSRIQKVRGTVHADRASGLLLALLLEELRSAASTAPEESSGAEQVIPLVIDWIEHHALPLPPLREIAASVGWSVNYFRDQFRAVSGQTAGEFLKQRRMSEAARLLVETRRPIKEIAMQAGYAEVASFHRAFCDRYKVTPGHYRDQRVLTI